MRSTVLAVSRKIQFLGKARFLDLLGWGPGNKDLVPQNVNSVECIDGIVIQTSCNNDVMFRELYVNGSYQDDVLVSLRSLLRPGDVLWDIGANYGFMSIYIDRYFSGNVDIFAFEPNPVVLMELERNLELNRCLNVTVESICLADRVGTADFYISKDHSWNATMIPEFAKKHAEDTKIEVAVSTIDECVKRLPPPNVIKLDVEGAEHLVVKGGEHFLRDGETSIVAEYNVDAIRDSGLTPGAYLDIFRDLGYRMHLLRRPIFGSYRWKSLHRVEDESQLPPLCNLILTKEGGSDR